MQKPRDVVPEIIVTVVIQAVTVVLWDGAETEVGDQ